MRQTAPLLVKLGRLATPKEPIKSDTVHGKANDFFREVVRCLPWVVNNYKLDEVTTVPQLRSNVAKLFKLHASMQNPAAVDMLIYKGREELEMVLLQHKQRHHLIADYLTNPQLSTIPNEDSDFLRQFYAGN